jgi:hypothetical protein
MFTITRPIYDFSAENSPSIKKYRVEGINPTILLVWIGRHVVCDHYKNSQWFGLNIKGDDYEFWFKKEADRDRCYKFLDEIIDRGIPKNRNWEEE